MSKELEISDELLLEMMRLYVEENLSLKEVGKRVGLSPPLIARRLRRAEVVVSGAEKQRVYKFTEEQLAEFKEMYEEGASYAEIRRRFDIGSDRTVETLLNQAGIAERRSRDTCKGVKRSNKQSQQLCWDCKKATGGCSWSKNFTPVPGWTAEKICSVAYNDVVRETYSITACPEFERG